MSTSYSTKQNEQSNLEKCRQEQWKKGASPSSFNQNMGYGDKCKVFHAVLANPPSIKDSRSSLYDIQDIYSKYFGKKKIKDPQNQPLSLYLITPDLSMYMSPMINTFNENS